MKANKLLVAGFLVAGAMGALVAINAKETSHCDHCHEVEAAAKCQRPFSDIIFEHNVVKIEGVDETCTYPGHEPYYACESCQKYWDWNDGYIGGPEALQVWLSEGNPGYIECCSHHWDNTIDLWGKHADCVSAGWEDAYYCLGGCECYYEYDTDELIGDASDYEIWKQTDGQIPFTGEHDYDLIWDFGDCITTGHNMYYYCCGCDSYFDMGYQPIEDIEYWLSINETGPTDDIHHSFIWVDEVESTCVEHGHEEYGYCDSCGKYYDGWDREISNFDEWLANEGTYDELADHHFEYIKPTYNCKTPGIEGYYKCTVCNQYFTDDSGDDTSLIGSESDLIIWKAGEGHKEAGHAYILAPGLNPNCTFDGYADAYYCPGCETYFERAHDESSYIGNQADYELWKETAGKLTGDEHRTHYFDSNYPDSCDYIGYGDIYQCYYCGQFFDEEDQLIGDANDLEQWKNNEGRIYGSHDWTFIEGQEPTEDKAGYKSALYCEECCWYFDADGNPIGADYCDYVDWKQNEGYLKPVHHLELVEGVDPTCLTTGYQDAYYCEKCSTYYEDENEDYEIGDATDYENWKSSGAGGFLDKTDHEYQLISGKTPNCVEDGYEDAYYCEVCSNYYDNDYIIIGDETAYNSWKETDGFIASTNNHGYVEVPGKAATCYEDGYEVAYLCEGCSQYFYGQDSEMLIGDYSDYLNWTTGAGSIVKLDHEFTLVPAVEPDCLNPGHLECYKCNHCSIYFVDNEGTQRIGDEEEYANWCANAGRVVDSDAHDLELVSGQTSTCISHGYKDCYQCTICDLYFEDANGETLIGDSDAYTAWCQNGNGVLDFSDHSYSLLPGKDASCTADGYKDCYFCNVCKKYFTLEGEEIGSNISDYNAWKAGEGKLPGGHDYKISYEWNEDMSSCTASATCSICKEVISEDAVVTNYENIVIATFNNSLFKTQIVEIIPPHTEHTYVITYVWNEDKTSCTATAKCSACEDEISENAMIISSVNVVFATFSNPLFETQFVEISAPHLEHTYTISYFWSDDNSICIAKAECSVCGYSITENATISQSENTLTATFNNSIFSAQTKEIPTEEPVIPKEEPAEESNKNKTVIVASVAAASGAVVAGGGVALVLVLKKRKHL